MKQAILIGAYKHHDQLLKLVSLFPAEHFNIYIHLNRIGEIDFSEFINDTKNLKNVYVYSHFKIRWGGVNHLKSLLFLSEIALQDSSNYFYHYITGQDLPVKPISFFLNELDTSKDYLQTVPYPVSYLPGGAKDWFEYYLFYDLLDSRRYLKYIKLLKNIQKKFRIKRDFNNFFEKKYYGSTYWSLTRPTLQYIIDYTKNKPSFLKRLRYTFCAEEIYVSSIVLNSPYSSNVINNNLRFIQWEKSGKGGSPKFLDELDFDEIFLSDKIFARKFEPGMVNKALEIFWN